MKIMAPTKRPAARRIVYQMRRGLKAEKTEGGVSVRPCAGNTRSVKSVCDGKAGDVQKCFFFSLGGRAETARATRSDGVKLTMELSLLAPVNSLSYTLLS